MDSKSPRSKRRDNVLVGLDIAIQLLSTAKDACGVPPAQVALGSACALLTLIRNTMGNKDDFADLGLFCAHVCKALDRGLGGKESANLSKPVHTAIEQLRKTIDEIRGRVEERSKRDMVTRILHMKGDKDAIAAWTKDLDRVLQVFNTELAINTHVMVAGMYQKAIQYQSIPVSVPSGELPPPAPKACFGRVGIVEEIVGHAEKLESIALIGGGGIGKTSIALTVLHHDRVKERFGDNRRFISCDQFTASSANFLARLSKVIGAGVENPEDLASLRPLFSSKEMFIVLDNAESILDPHGTDSQEIYAMVDELCQFETICLCITSRITTVPRYCKRPQIPTLSMEAACEIFYGIHGDGERSGIIDELLRRLDFHALSITLLATTASDNTWDHGRLSNEWDERRSQVLRTDRNESLEATIEVSLNSPTFLQLGTNARDLLKVVAFFPQGVDEKNLDWLFPTTPDRKDIFDKFCVLSLVYRSNGFVTMLAPIRDYLCPQDTIPSPLLWKTKDFYFTRLSVDLYPGKSGFAEAEWIKSEDVNVEHLLKVFIPIERDPLDVWDPCAHFMDHLYWHKPRQTVLGSKIKDLPDRRPFKPRCLFKLSQLFGSVGKHIEQKQLLTHALKLERERGGNSPVARTPRSLSHANRTLGLHEEGTRQAKEALQRVGDMMGQAECLHDLTLLLLYNDQLDAAADVALRTIDSLPEKGQEYLLSRSHCVLGEIYDFKREKGKAFYHYETALGIASPFGWQQEIFWIHYALALLFATEDEFDNANAHIAQAKSRTVDNTYEQGRAMNMQAWIWYRQRRLEDARSESFGAVEVYKKLGKGRDAGACGELYKTIEKATESRSISDAGVRGTPLIATAENSQDAGVEGFVRKPSISDTSVCGAPLTASAENSQGADIEGPARISHLRVVLCIIALLLIPSLFLFGY